ncbi:MAG: DUF131 domain-containing protein [Nitrososphaeraceae archaeon]
MVIFDVFVFASGIILIVIGSLLLYSFLVKPHKPNALTFKGILFLGPIPIIFNNENKNINLLSIILSISLITVFFVVFFLFLNYINL